jgi:DNA-binding CsgD family transcriptional regulator/tetratricopeptide (TPR) repeat protein
VTSGLVSPVFVGRRAERAELAEMVDAAVGGVAGFALVRGESGVGKSRLVADAADRARSRDVRVLWGNCVEHGVAGLPFAPLVDALRLLARTMPRADFEEVLGPARGPMLRLLPNLAPTPEVHVNVDSAQLLELVLGVVERLAERSPVLILIEDLHWADRSTLDLLAYLVRTLHGVPVLLLGTFRTDEINRRHPLHALLTAWERGRVVRRIDLARFERAEAAEQLAGILGETPRAALVDLVYERSDGNAFLTEEMLDAVRAGGDTAALPASLRDVLLSRVDALSPTAQRVVQAAAVAGGPVPEALLVAVSRLDEAEAFGALREVIERHLLVADTAGRGYSFRHALARDAVVDDMLPGERAKLHATYGEVLSARPELGGDDDAAVAAKLAIHWYAALDLPRALTASVIAAQGALQRYAPADASQHLERALQIWPRVSDAETMTGLDHVELLARGGRAAYESGEIGRSLAFYEQALDELRQRAGDPGRQVELLVAKAEALNAAGSSEPVIAELEAAVRLLPADEMTAERAAVLAVLASALMRAGQPKEAAKTAEQAILAAQASGAGQAEAEAEIALGHFTAGELADDDTGLLQLRAGIDRAGAEGQMTTALRGWIALSDALELRGLSLQAAEAAAEGIAFARTLGYHRSLATFLTGNMVESMVHLGRWNEARTMLTATLDTQPEGVFAATILDLEARLAALSGRYDDAERALARARALMGQHSETQYDSPLAFTLAELARARGDHATALTVLAGALHPGVSDALTARYDWPLVWLATRIQADLRRGGIRSDSEAVGAAVDAAFDTLEVRSAPAQGWRLTTAAERLRATGEDSAEAWEAASSAWRRANRPYELGYCLLRLAAARLATRERTAAAAAAREARAVADDLGALPLREMVDELLAGARLAPPTAPTDGLARFGLTLREREVLALLATGRTNPEIAKTLFISPKTASVHVSNILAKLGVASRVEAATLAEREAPRPAL